MSVRLRDRTDSAHAEQLRALVWEAWPHRHDPERAREHAEAIVEWHYLRPIARGDLIRTRELARAALAAELDRQSRHGPEDIAHYKAMSTDELIDLLRRTDPARIMARRAAA